MSAIAFAGVSAPAAFSSRNTMTKRQSRRMQRCYAAEDGERKLSFDANRRSGIGFTESDSAGQTNIFAVEPKAYVSGTGADVTSDSANDTLSLAAVAGSVAVGAIIAGLATLTSTVSDETVAFATEYQTLSTYKAQFTSEIAAAAPAPAAAPEVAAE